MADGEGGEVGVHPHFRRGGWEAGELMPEVPKLFRLGGDPGDIGKSDGFLKQLQRIAVGNHGRIVMPLQGWCGDETQP